MANTAPNLAKTDANGIEQNKPSVINTGDGQQSGLPTTSSLARGNLPNTTLAKMNDSLEHVCDITGNIKYSIAWVSFKISEAIQAIRTFLEGLWAGTTGSPFGDQIRQAIKYIKGKVAIIKKYIQKAKDAMAAVQKFIADVQTLIAYIATLPAKIAAILKQCLTDAVSSVKDAINNSKNIIKLHDAAAANSALANTETNLAKTETSNTSSTMPTYERP
jgi:hypothetical protein